jgi:glycosyltransferase involved in cell wall biosynthesis
MRITYDLRRILNPGIGRYMTELLKCIFRIAPGNEYSLIMAPGTESSVEIAGANAKIVLCKSPYYSVSEQFTLPRIARRQRAELIHSPHFLMPLAAPCPVIVTIHDCIYITCKEDLRNPIGRIYYRSMMQLAAWRAAHIVTVSEFSRQDIIRLLGVAPERVSTIYNAYDVRFRPVADPSELLRVREKYGASKDFILYTGIYKFRKNHAGLLRSFARLRQKGVDAQLLIAGALEEGEWLLRAQAFELGIADDVVLAGRVDEADLPALYSAARVYACPSNYEGFGFTIVEAMACGVPVVCNPATCLPEVAGDAALWADANDPEAFSSALRRAFVENDLRAAMIERGFENIKRFNWEQAARETLDLYARVLHARDRQ